ncbi:hypothetical protein [Corynebacterium pacaense]|uniref:hypothetical protein n=1 Tax=Corynebacterium pacaense TaxID=1816684 RepID=UPI0009BBB09E|nr:hypothetical protein [Corynebacterium pacaense]
MNPNDLHIHPEFDSLAASAHTEIRAPHLNLPLLTGATAAALTRAEALWRSDLARSDTAVGDQLHGIRDLARTFRSMDATLGSALGRLW